MENVGRGSLNAAQRTVLSQKEIMAGYELEITANNRTVSSFGNGEVKVTLPLVLRNGTAARDYNLYYVAENGALERMNAACVNDTISFTTKHFSDYVVTLEALPFTDVSGGLWYYEAVSYCYENNYFKGVTATRFNPNGTMNRAMFATVLHRLAGEPITLGENSFLDVENDRYYTRAITWAVQRGIIAGYGDGLFGINDPVTREQMVTMFWRWNGRPVAPPTALAEFADAENIRPWAVDAFAWAVNADIISGKGNGFLDPKGTATRAEVAQIVLNFFKSLR